MSYAGGYVTFLSRRANPLSDTRIMTFENLRYQTPEVALRYDLFAPDENKKDADLSVRFASQSR